MHLGHKTINLRISGIFCVFMAFLLSACTHTNPGIHTSVIQKKYFPGLSSASGISMHKGLLYVVGDDVPWLFTLDTSMNIHSIIQLSSVDTLNDGRTPKELKADFEAMEAISLGHEDYLLIISSGSMEGSRDTSILWNTGQGAWVKKNLRPIYNNIKTHAGIHDEREINIEAVAANEEDIFLFHRGNVSGNLIAVMEKEAFLNYILGTTQALPELHLFRFELPVLGGLSAGFSGACYLAEYDALLFTASLENTGNEVDDGEIMGSYIGLIPLSGLKYGAYVADLLKAHGTILPKKLESITLQHPIGQKQFVVFSSCDNDDGSSDIFQIKIDITHE